MLRIWMFFLVSVLNVFAQARNQAAPLPVSACLNQAPWGMPASKVQVQVICRRGYVTANDLNARLPKWVSYTLTPANALGCIPRTNAFAVDQSLPPGQRATPQDYAGTGYDMGHNAPDGDMSWDMQVELESFLMSNMMPQLPGLNRGIWKLLETATRGWAVQRGHTLQVVSGPIYFYNNPTIGTNRVIVPHAFYKVILDTQTREAMGFWFHHQGGQGNDLTRVRKSIVEIQLATGLEFQFPPNSVEVPLNQIWPVDYGQLTNAKRSVCRVQ